ncbi:hypothetical protein LTR53_006455 [Teratosphaeriaceae sp. CCFEE 6253]|nr:hypothetical protein LTR53_006455 [Teratosphaeriaceae sp. CCFEE 6253]
MDAAIGYPPNALPPPLLYALVPFATVAVLLALVRACTTWRYRASLKQFANVPNSGKPQVVESPQIPYTLPWLGNTISFLSPVPGKFFDALFRWHPRSTGICTLLIGGRKTHILFSPPAVHALFKAKSPSRDVFERELFRKVFQLPDDQIHNAEKGKHMEHEMNSKYLTNFERVNELTAQFCKVLGEVLVQDAADVACLDRVGLYQWLRDRMFTASTTALMGEKLLERYPGYCEDFFGFDGDFLSFFFQLPRLLMGEAFNRRQRLLDKLEAWSLEMHELSGGTPTDPEGPAWEPIFGSRLNRARQMDYKTRSLNTRTGAALDLGITFGLSSNVIPATGWMLMHLLDPKSASMLARVMEELHAAQKPDGSIDVHTLVSQPQLQSLWTETLRLYTDVLVTRNLSEDILLPLDEDDQRHVKLRRGDNVFAPSWLGHHDPTAWTIAGKAPHDVFDAERFLTVDSKTGKTTFSMSGTATKLFPFGGGRTICPGRVFAKQEALGALAIVLLTFEFEVKGFVDAKKKPTSEFPGYARAFAGSGAVVPGGDIMVKMKRRQS